MEKKLNNELNTTNNCTINADRLNFYDGTNEPKLLVTVKDVKIAMVDEQAMKKDWIKHIPSLANAIAKHLAQTEKKTRRLKI